MSTEFKDKVIELLDKAIFDRHQCVKGFQRNPVNIKQKRSLQKMVDAIVLLRDLKRKIKNIRIKEV